MGGLSLNSGWWFLWGNHVTEGHTGFYDTWNILFIDLGAGYIGICFIIVLYITYACYILFCMYEKHEGWCVPRFCPLSPANPHSCL